MRYARELVADTLLCSLIGVGTIVGLYYFAGFSVALIGSLSQ